MASSNPECTCAHKCESGWEPKWCIVLCDVHGTWCESDRHEYHLILNQFFTLTPLETV